MGGVSIHSGVTVSKSIRTNTCQESAREDERLHERRAQRLLLWSVVLFMGVGDGVLFEHTVVLGGVWEGHSVCEVFWEFHRVHKWGSKYMSSFRMWRRLKCIMGK